MKTWSLVNPSENHTFEAPDLEIATAAVLLVNQAYGAHEIDGIEKVPVLGFLTDAEINDWFRTTFGLPFDEWFARVTAERRIEVATALDSFLVGTAEDRAIFRRGIEPIPESERNQWRSDWNEERRHSMNKIGRWAWSVAADLRRTAARVSS